jgi:adenylosuccinate synthase
MNVDVILGLQWGDEGKGKIVDVLAPNYDVIARFQGGPNAGHTLEFNNNKFVLHTIPSGIFHKGKINIIGNGVVIDPVVFCKELEEVEKYRKDARNDLYLSKRAHLIIPTHRLLDAAYENSKGDLKIGSTLKGISPTYTDKISRNGLRVGDISDSDFFLKFEKLTEWHFRILNMLGFSTKNHLIDGLSFEEFSDLWRKKIIELQTLNLIDSELYINELLKSGKSVLAEGAQGTLLDIDFGSYPFVTSSNTTCGGVCTGLGIAPNKIRNVFGIFKAYCTRVGSGPFPTELENETGEELRKKGFEFGSTTGRPRRCGWLDLPALKYAIELNGVNKLIMTKADVLDSFEQISICEHYVFDGKDFFYPPYEICNKEISPVLKNLSGWQTSINKIRNKTELPESLIKYIQSIEDSTKTRISLVSTGPDREQIIEL